MSKKVGIKTKDINQAKVPATNLNAKVTVQYIQEKQIIQKPVDANQQQNHGTLPAVAPDDLEVENVEYLEENPNVEEYVEEPSEKDELEDNFYPNAIHCLLDLYKAKFESLNTESRPSKAAEIWRDIAKSMQDSFFEFNERQIQYKYSQLRKQYFGVQTKEDIENFDYFDELHGIYKDKSRENILRDLKAPKTGRVFYKDEVLLHSEHLDSNELRMHHFKSEEIIHKEHEFIDMVEKELQAMEDGLQADCNRNATKMVEGIDTKDIKPVISSKEDKVSNDVETVEDQQNPKGGKRLCSNTQNSEEPPQRRQKLSNEHFPIDQNEFNLYHYNREQERRHCEKVSLLERSLQIQENVLELQQQLLQELIKRYPS